MYRKIIMLALHKSYTSPLWGGIKRPVIHQERSLVPAEFCRSYGKRP